MKLYYHHVGQQGAAEDFPKTVFNTRRITEVQEAIPKSEPLRASLVAELRERFPSGEFNCWGVPSGADRVISSLAPGDVVLLVESTHITGGVPALCQVEVFLPQELPSLSMQLWGSHKYPFVFFFMTEVLDLQWIRLLDHLGYHENFDPRGRFYSVAESRLAPYGGAEGYTRLLRNQFARNQPYRVVSPEALKSALRDKTVQYASRVEGELERQHQSSILPDPQLTDSAGRRNRTVRTTTARSQAFRLAIRELYDSACAICARKLLAPDGGPETEAAHIYPKRLDGADDYRNGLCLCRTHHWALDSGWIAIGDDLIVLVRDDVPASQHYAVIRDFSGRTLRAPSDPRFSPHPIYLSAHRELHGFQSSAA